LLADKAVELGYVECISHESVRTVPIPAFSCQPERHDYEYRRCGMCNIFIACEPLAGIYMYPTLEENRRTNYSGICLFHEAST
jgi:hypothetical protein